MRFHCLGLGGEINALGKIRSPISRFIECQSMHRMHHFGAAHHRHTLAIFER
jgi:hypothetical protein